MVNMSLGIMILYPKSSRTESDALNNALSEVVAARRSAMCMSLLQLGISTKMRASATYGQWPAAASSLAITVGATLYDDERLYNIAIMANDKCVDVHAPAPGMLYR